ncbi:hypothetical protein GLOIN_2v1840269 [Rhizophagus irregularis DAOM 181602=DAOM 197198]|nr:hypothetical protein GLOIN_2v1840269 [Rhizophagus irregularis DAOM 181602=DAOM 197198]
MLFFDQSEEWSLLNFIKYLDSIESLRDSSEPHRKYGIILNGIKNDENESQKKRERAEQALEKCLVESDNPAIELDEKRSSEIQEFWQQKKLQISLKEKTIKSTERMISHINTIQDEASDILVLSKRDNLRRLKSDLGVGDNIENGGLTKSPYEDQESDDDFMPARQPKRKKPLSLSKKNKESVGSTKKAKTMKDTLSSLHRVPKPSSSAGVTKPFSSSLESAINSPEPRTPPHRIFSYSTSSGSSVCKEHGSKDDTSEDDLLIKSPVDITVDFNYPGDFGEFRRIKVYGVQIYDHDFYIYSMCMPFAGTMRDMIISSTKSVMSYITNPISESSNDAKIDKVKTSPRKKNNN